MERPPRPDHWDLVAGGTAIALLALGVGVLTDPLLEYAAWLTIFSIWMLWFVYYGVKWIYGGA
jgi:hypothetical protein